MIYTEDELLQEWERRIGLLEQDCGCVVSHHDGGALQAALRSRLRSWYATLLLEAPPELLPVRDVAAEVTNVYTDASGVMHVQLPADCGQVLAVKLRGWTRPATRLLSPDHREVRRCRMPGGGPEPCRPLAMMQAGELLLAPAAARLGSTADDLEMLLMTAPPLDGSYELHRSLLDRLPPLT